VIDGHGDEDARRQNVQAGRDAFVAGHDIGITVNIHYRETQQSETPQSFQPGADTTGDVVVTLADLLDMEPESAAEILEMVTPHEARLALSYMPPREASAIFLAMEPGDAASYLSVMSAAEAARVLEEMNPDAARRLTLCLGAGCAGQILTAMEEQRAIDLTLAVDGKRQVADLLIAMENGRALKILEHMEIGRRKESIELMTSERASVLRILAQDSLELAERKLQEDEAKAAEASARRLKQAEALSRQLRARQRNEKRLKPLTWGVRAAAWTLLLISVLLASEYYAHYPILVVVDGVFALASACVAMFSRFDNAGAAVTALISFCAADTDSVLQMLGAWPPYATIPLLLASWLLGITFTLAAAGGRPENATVW
jgi:hypothetical protein